MHLDVATDRSVHWPLLATVLSAAAICGCETAVDPFEESNIHFSVMGVLDASADTQFVRVAPLRRTIYSEAEPIDAVVTVEHLASGSRKTWRDSLFRYSDGRTAYVFWSTQDIEPDQTYRLTVMRSDGAESTATVTVPAEFPEPLLTSGAEGRGSRPFGQSIWIPDVRYLVELRVTYDIYLPDRSDGDTIRYVVSYLDRVRYHGGGASVAFRVYPELVRQLNACPLLHEAEVFVAVGNAEWPDVAKTDLETQARPDVLTNIENGTGFLGGVVTKTLPWGGLRGLFAKEYSYRSARGRCGDV